MQNHKELRNNIVPITQNLDHPIPTNVHPLDTDSFEGSQDGATQSTTNAPQVAATAPVPTHPMMT